MDAELKNKQLHESKLFWAYDITRDANIPLRVRIDELEPSDPDYQKALKSKEFNGFRDDDDVLAAQVRWAQKHRAEQVYRVGEEINVPLETYFPMSRFPNMRLVHAEHPKTHFVVTEVNEAEGSITLASALIEEKS